MNFFISHNNRNIVSIKANMSEDDKANSSSIKDIYTTFKSIYDSYSSFSLKENLKLLRIKLNDKLSVIPLMALNEPTKELANNVKAHLLYASNYLHDNYPYAATLSRSHGYLISGALVFSLALSPLRSNLQLNFEIIIYL